MDWMIKERLKKGEDTSHFALCVKKLPIIIYIFYVDSLCIPLMHTSSQIRDLETKKETVDLRGRLLPRVVHLSFSKERREGRHRMHYTAVNRHVLVGICWGGGVIIIPTIVESLFSILRVKPR